MNILILTTHANTGGITSYILTLAEGLVKSGHKVLVASSGGDCVPLMEAVGIRHIKINIRTKSEIHPKLSLSLGPLARLVREEGINVIHAQTRVTQVLGFFLSRMTGVAMITTCHGFFRPRWFRRIFPCWGKMVIAISKPVLQHLKADFGVAQNKICLIPNGIDLNRFVVADDQRRRQARQELGINHAPLIGIIARLSDVKGIEVLIKAMPDVLKRIPLAQLIIVGQGPEEENLKKLTQDLALTGQIHFKNIIHQAQDLLPAFDVFVMPSLMEGLGLSVIEAQACGIPVVASRIGGLIDLIEDGKTGYLVPVNDPAFLAARVVDLLQNHAQSRVMAQQARLNIEQHYSSQNMLKETVKVYEQYSCR